MTRGDAKPAVDVVLVAMKFPVPSEAFAGVEVRALRRAGADIRVRALRGRHGDADALLRDWRLDTLDVSSWSPAAAWRGLVFACRHPMVALSTIAWVVRRAVLRPVLLGRCLALLPRMFDVFAECQKNPPQVLCLYWGHYPAVLAHMVIRWLPGVHVSMSLGAYDLVYAFPPSIDVASRAHSLWTMAGCNEPEMRRLGIDTRRLRVSIRGIDIAQVPADCLLKDHEHVITVARLEENKGVDDVLRAFASAATRFPRLRLTVIGEGPDHPRLESMAQELGIAERVQFTGALVHSAVYRALQSAGVFMLLSRSPAERLPNAVKEALACRCSCIVTRTPGIEDLLEPLSRQLVVEQGDWQAAAGKLCEVIEGPGKFESDRDAGRSFVLTKLDASMIAEERIATWTGSLPGASH